MVVQTRPRLHLYRAQHLLQKGCDFCWRDKNDQNLNNLCFYVKSVREDSQPRSVTSSTRNQSSSNHKDDTHTVLHVVHKMRSDQRDSWYHTSVWTSSHYQCSTDNTQRDNRVRKSTYQSQISFLFTSE